MADEFMPIVGCGYADVVVEGRRCRGVPLPGGEIRKIPISTKIMTTRNATKNIRTTGKGTDLTFCQAIPRTGRKIKLLDFTTSWYYVKKKVYLCNLKSRRLLAEKKIWKQQNNQSFNQ